MPEHPILKSKDLKIALEHLTKLERDPTLLDGSEYCHLKRIMLRIEREMRGRKEREHE